MKSAFVVVVAALGTLAFAADCAADTLYKLIDRNGKVTYSETAPKDFDASASTGTPKPRSKPCRKILRTWCSWTSTCPA